MPPRVVMCRAVSLCALKRNTFVKKYERCVTLTSGSRSSRSSSEASADVRRASVGGGGREGSQAGEQQVGKQHAGRQQASSTAKCVSAMHPTKHG